MFVNNVIVKHTCLARFIMRCEFWLGEKIPKNYASYPLHMQYKRILCVHNM